MICKHCGYDVPSGIDFCTNCGEPMPIIRQEPEETAEAAPQQEQITDKKYFIKNYVPHSFRLCIHGAGLISYIYSGLYLLIAIGGLLLDGFTLENLLILGAVLIFTGLSLIFHLKKNTFCAVLVTVIAVAFSIACYMLYKELTFIWIFAGILGVYGCAKLNGLWNKYKRTGKLPPKVD